MKRNFLNKKIFLFLIFIGYIFFKISFLLLIPIIILISLLVFFLRRDIKNFRDETIETNNVIVSPVNGYVSNIVNVENESAQDSFKEIHLILPILKECGLHLPYNCEVTQRIDHKDGKSFFRFDVQDDEKWSNKSFSNLISKNKNIEIYLQSAERNELRIIMFKCLLGFYPQIWIQSGDRGKTGSCFGFFPIGGLVVLKVPNNFEIFVKKNDEVIAGQTLIGCYKI